MPLPSVLVGLIVVWSLGVAVGSPLTPPCVAPPEEAAPSVDVCGGVGVDAGVANPDEVMAAPFFFPSPLFPRAPPTAAAMITTMATTAMMIIPFLVR